MGDLLKIVFIIGAIYFYILFIIKVAKILIGVIL